MLSCGRRILIALALTAALPSLAASNVKTALETVTAEARKWQADAVLTHVSTLQGQGDGRATQWLYTFYSPATKKSAIITARDKAVTLMSDDSMVSVLLDGTSASFIRRNDRRYEALNSNFASMVPGTPGRWISTVML